MAKYKVTVSWVVEAPNKPEAVAVAAKQVGEVLEYVTAKKVQSPGWAQEVFNQIGG